LDSKSLVHEIHEKHEKKPLNIQKQDSEANLKNKNGFLGSLFMSFVLFVDNF